MQNGVSVLPKMQTGDGRPIPARLKIEIEREWKRLKMVAEQVREIEAERDRLVKGSEPSGDACTEKMRRLVKLHGIGAEFATVLTREVFYRPFQNRRQVASYVGLTPAPYDSGDTKHDQGINKAGNTRARVIAVQMAWLWLRYQSKSELSLWYYSRVGDLKGRVRRIMIIALARKLVIALWRYVETGKVKPLAVGSLERVAILPNVPTVNESAVAGFDVSVFFGIAAPSNTPRDIIERISREVAAIDKMPDMRDKTAPLGYDLIYLDSRQFADKIAKDHARYGKVIREAGITPD